MTRSIVKSFVILLGTAVLLQSRQPLQADVIEVQAASGFVALVQAQARRGRTGWEGKLFTTGADPEINPPGAPFWDPSEYYQFQLSLDTVSGTASWWLDANRDQSLSTGEFVSATDAGLQGQAVNHIELYMEGRHNFNEQAYLRNLNINGTSVGGVFASGLDVQEFYFRDSDKLDWTTVEIRGEMRLTWDTRSNGGHQERPRVWLSVGDGVSSVPEPQALAALTSLVVSFLWRHRRHNAGTRIDSP